MISLSWKLVTFSGYAFLGSWINWFWESSSGKSDCKVTPKILAIASNRTTVNSVTPLSILE